MTQAPLTLRRWKRVEYDRLVDLGVFEGEPLELIGGQLIVAEPKGAYHSSAVSTAEYALRAVLPPGWIVRTQLPVSLDDESEPEPDVAVTHGARRSYSRQHPSRPALVVEVAESRLAFDREHKGSLYARARLEDYWLVNLVDRVLEVYRRPVPDPASPFGWRYASKEVLSTESFVELLAAPGTRILVSDLLP